MLKNVILCYPNTNPEYRWRLRAVWQQVHVFVPVWSIRACLHSTQYDWKLCITFDTRKQPNCSAERSGGTDSQLTNINRLLSMPSLGDDVVGESRVHVVTHQ
jgi:hypothetical protein